MVCLAGALEKVGERLHDRLAGGVGSGGRGGGAGRLRILGARCGRGEGGEESGGKGGVEFHDERGVGVQSHGTRPRIVEKSGRPAGATAGDRSLDSRAPAGQNRGVSTIPPPVVVDNAAALAALARELERAAEIAVDTEADSFFSYREKVCLLQVSTERADYLVDPLASIDLAELRGAFAARTPRKVFHDAENDVQLLKLAGLGEISSVFDTRIAVSLLGIKTPGLANVLKDRYGITLDKSEQRSDWRRRPLTEEQLDYARHDTRHLLRLARDVEQELRGRDLWDLFAFECDRVAAAAPRDRAFHPEDVLGYRGARDLDGAGLAALRELAIERDGIASRRDVAPFRVVPNEILVLLAQVRPRDATALAAIRGIPPRLREPFARPALTALARARAQGPWIPPRPRDSRRGDRRAGAAAPLAHQESGGAEDGLVGNSESPHDGGDRPQAPAHPRGAARDRWDRPWQFDRFAAEILQIVGDGAVR